MSAGIQIQGKELSYNNIQDGSAALNLIKEFDAPTCVALKHMNPCGVGTADTLLEAWYKAYAADPISIFGGIVAFNRTVDADIARQCVDIFLEIILAPKYTEEALQIFASKKNLRVLHFPHHIEKSFNRATVRISGGLLVQAVDDHSTDVKDYKCVTKQALDQAWISDLEMGEWVVKHVKSNAVVIIKEGQTVGIGAGQMASALRKSHLNKPVIKRRRPFLPVMPSFRWMTRYDWLPNMASHASFNLEVPLKIRIPFQPVTN